MPQLVVEVLAYRHIFHLRSDYTFAGIVHLCDAVTLLGAAWFMLHREAYLVQASVVAACFAIFARYVILHFSVVTHFHPHFSIARQTFVDIHAYRRVGKWPGCVIYGDILVGIFHALAIFNLYGGVLAYLAHSHFHAGQSALHIYFL